MSHRDDGDARAAIRARELDLWAAFAARDLARIGHLIGPDAIDVGPGGIRSRDDVLGAVSGMHLASYDLFDFQVLPITDAVEIVTYQSHVEGTYRGKPFAFGDVICSSVWVRHDGAWRLAYRCESPSRQATDAQGPAD